MKEVGKLAFTCLEMRLLWVRVANSTTGISDEVCRETRGIAASALAATDWVTYASAGILQHYVCQVIGNSSHDVVLCHRAVRQGRQEAS